MMLRHSPPLRGTEPSKLPGLPRGARIRPTPGAGAVSCSTSLAAAPGWGSSSFTQVSATFSLSELVELWLVPAQGSPLSRCSERRAAALTMAAVLLQQQLPGAERLGCP